MKASQIARQARTDQIAAALRDAQEPLRVGDIPIGGELHFSKDAPGQVDCDGPGSYVGIDHWHECVAGGCYRVLRAEGRVLQGELTPLLRDGLVTRAKMDRAVYWTWAGESIDMSEFEAALEAQR